MLSTRNLTHRSFSLLTAAGLSTLLAGCPQPDASFDDFAARYAKANPPGPAAAGGETVQEVEGDFLFTLSATLKPEKPLLFVAKLTTTDAGLTLNVQPLAIDRKTLVGEAHDLGPYPIEDGGKLVADLPELTIPGEANPITKCTTPGMCSGSEIVADAALAGAVCEDFICGDVTGKVTKPLPLPLSSPTKSSKFTMQRLEKPGEYPEPPEINCEHDLALTVDKI